MLQSTFQHVLECVLTKALGSHKGIASGLLQIKLDMAGGSHILVAETAGCHIFQLRSSFTFR